MTNENAQKLQERMTTETIALLIATGQAADPAPYENAVALIGKAWDIPAEDMKTGRTIQEIGEEILCQHKAKEDYLVNTRSIIMENWNNQPRVYMSD